MKQLIFQNLKDQRRKPAERKRQQTMHQDQKETIREFMFNVLILVKQEDQDRPDKRGGQRSKARRKPIVKEEPSPEEVQKQVRETLEKLQGKSKKGKGAKYRREKRDLHRQQVEKDLEQQEAESKVLKVTEFVTANEVATMMNVLLLKLFLLVCHWA